MKPSPASASATLVLALVSGAAVYFFATERGRRVASEAGGHAARGADASARWMRAHTPAVQPQLARIERQIDALGDDLRRRLDAIQGGVRPDMDATSWTLDRADLGRDLRDLPG